MKHETGPYNPVIESKLEQLAGVDADHLWEGMHAVLDKEMPEKRERRRFIAWLLTDRRLFSFGIALLITATAICLFYLSPNKTSTIANSTNIISRSTNNFEKNNTPVAHDTKTENVTTGFNEISGDQITDPLSQGSAHRISNVAVSSEKDRPVKYAVKNEDIHSIYSQPAASVHQVGQMQANVDDNTTMTEATDQNESYVTSEDFNPVSRDEINSEQHQNSTVDEQENVAVAPAVQRIGTRNEKGLYGGIVMGVDLSSVQFQSVRTGASQGLILGYAFNNKWSVESGVLWDKKRFYDDGTYFNPPGYTPSTAVQIVSVSGTNGIYEWPINVRYTIIPRKHSVFATAGMSSYFMKSEHYEYEYVQNNQPGGHNYITYNNATKNWFSVLNFSLGYAHKLGSIGSLRIEPYFKIPLKNLGAANMPIMSTGLNIGFTRSLTR